MLVKFLLLYFILNLNYFQIKTYPYDEDDDCDLGGCEQEEFMGKCGHATQFSKKELENVRIYLQTRFRRTGPLKPACKTLRVRKNINCLSKRELFDLTNVFKALYANGVMDLFGLIHGTYWNGIHKFAEAVPWHRWHINELEKEMRKINPNITLPYWEYITDFSAPEKSKVWNTFGRAGSRSNGYCIPDGPFANQRVRFPEKHCVKRQWNLNKTIPVWESPEWVTSLTQTSGLSWPQFARLLGFSAHFKTHLSVGGYEGEMSANYANNDPIFYLFHAHVADYAILKWQLINDQNLLPLSYNRGQRYDWEQQQILGADIENDYLTYYENTQIKEVFQMAFGDLCYIQDQFVKPINDIIHKRRPKLPKAVHNLKNSLPNYLFEKYYPKFATKTATFFDHFLPEPYDSDGNDFSGDYNEYNDICNEFPVALAYNSTPNGRRLLNIFRTEVNIDITPDVFYAEQEYYKFAKSLTKSRYCSPYIK